MRIGRRRGCGINSIDRGDPRKFRAALGTFPIWLRARNITLNGSDAASIVDQSGTGNTVGDLSGARPGATTDAAGRPIVVFVAANVDVLSKASANLFGTGSYSIFSCWKSGGGSNKAFFSNGASSSAGLILGTLNGSTSRNLNHNNVSTHIDGVMQTSAPEIWAAIYSSGVQPGLAVNGTDQSMSHSGGAGMTSTNGVLSMGAYWTGAAYSNFADLTFYELFAFTQPASSSQSKRMQRRLGALHGVAVAI